MRYTITGATVGQVQQAGGQDIKATRYTGHIFANLTRAQADALRALPGVKVREVDTFQAPRPRQQSTLPTAPPYSLSQVGQLVGLDTVRNLFTTPLLGDGVNIAIIDTGIRETHELVNGRVVYRQNCTSDTMEDGFDHGTGVASVVVGLAPHCQILNIKVIDNSGIGTDETVVTGIDAAISLWETNPNLAPQIINLSLGSQDDGDAEDPVRVACRTAIQQGIWVIAGAGNDGPDASTIDCPACEEGVLAVGSVGYDPSANSFTISSFSSRGPTQEGLTKPDVVLFGENIELASSQSDTATATKSGTSFACPMASAMTGLYLQAAGLVFSQSTPSPVLGAGLYQVAQKYLPLISLKPAGAPAAKDDSYGYGLPLGTLALSNAQQSQTSALPTSGVTSLMEQYLLPLMMVAMVGMVMSQTVEV